jgi:heat shock protein HtpX
MLVLMVIAVILAIIAPILAQLIQLAVSRQREYLADASAVELTRQPLGLANALRKIENDPDDFQFANRGTAHLFIANPIERFESRAHTMFASHPPLEDRIRRLEALAHQMPGKAQA